MAAHDVYRKTALGHAEIANRKLKLHPRIRTMLIMIDGARAEAEMRAEAQQVGAPAEFIEQLAALGLIEKVRTAAAAPEPPLARTRPGVPKDDFERFRVAKSFMNNAAVDALGLRSFMFTMRLEKAATLE